MNKKRFNLGVWAVSLLAGQAVAGSDTDFDRDFGFHFVTIGDPGNEPYNDRSVLRGGVDYEYRIARNELSSGQYLEYFNLLLPKDLGTHADLFPRGSSSLLEIGNGVPVWFMSGLVDPANAGVEINFKQAAMFCNWMHNGQKDDIESLMDGAYDISTFGRDPDTGEFFDQSAHHPDARYWIPTYDELLKASFYDPDKNGQGPGWWNYPHSSDEPAVIGLPGEGDVPRGMPLDELRAEFGSAVFYNTIPLGIYPEVQSPWGLLDTLGGAREWTETWEDDTHRRRLTRWSNNISFVEDPDHIGMIWDVAPSNSGYGLRIASAIPPAADLDRNWKVDWFDVSYFLERYLAGDLEVDLNDDLVLDGNDVFVFIDLLD